MKIFFILSWAFMFVALLNVVLYQLIKWRTLKHYIIPYMRFQDMEILDVQFKGFPNSRIGQGYLDLGDFGEKKITFLPVPIMGNLVLDTYITIYVKRKDGNILRYTSKVRTAFFSIRKVELKGNGTSVVIDKYSISKR